LLARPFSLAPAHAFDHIDFNNTATNRTQGSTRQMTTKTFEIGRTYYARSLCDYDCVFSFTIRARTAKTVTVDVHGKTVSRGVRVVDGVESFKPFGSYSMAAVIYAERELIGDETADQADARRREAAKVAA
jgi:hypothetical protein